MAANRHDQDVLSADITFQGRVRQALVAACFAISSEGWSVLYHENRIRQCTLILQNLSTVVPIYSMGVATDASVIGDATQAGTVGLTPANVVAQQALVTDAHIDSALSGQFNAFFVPLRS